MNDLANATTPSPTQPHQRGHRLLFLLLLLIFLSISYGLWQQITSFHQELQQQINNLNQQVIDLKTELQTLLMEEDQENNKAEAFETRLQRLENFSQKPPEADWVLAETAYLLTIANYKLMLAQDLEGALTALKTAYQHLAHLKQTEIIAVNNQISQEINQLSKLVPTDLFNVAKRLAHQMSKVDNLPLLQGAYQPPPKPTPLSIEKWQDLGTVVWEQLKQLVVIHYNSQAETGLLTTNQRRFIAQSLKLNLEMAHFSLLRRDTQQFVASIQSSLDWLTRYYDQTHPEVQSLQKDLEAMQHLVLVPPLPDISNSLTTLRKLLTATQ